MTGTGDKHVAIGDVLKDEGLADSAYLVIRAKRIACAELGCGW